MARGPLPVAHCPMSKRRGSRSHFLLKNVPNPAQECHRILLKNVTESVHRGPSPRVAGHTPRVAGHTPREEEPCHMPYGRREPCHMPYGKRVPGIPSTEGVPGIPSTERSTPPYTTGRVLAPHQQGIVPARLVPVGGVRPSASSLIVTARCLTVPAGVRTAVLPAGQRRLRDFRTISKSKNGFLYLFQLGIGAHYCPEFLHRELSSAKAYSTQNK